MRNNVLSQWCLILTVKLVKKTNGNEMVI